MPRHDQEPPRISMSYLLGVSNKPYKEKRPPPLQPHSRESRHAHMMRHPGGMIEWIASDGRKGQLSKNLQRVIPSHKGVPTTNFTYVTRETFKPRAHNTHPKAQKTGSTFHGTLPNAPPGSVMGSEGAFGGLFMDKLEAVAAERNDELKKGQNGNKGGTLDAGDINPEGFTTEQDEFIVKRRTENVGEPWINVANDLPGDQKSADQCKERFKAIKPKDWKPNNSKGGNKGEGKQKGKNKGEKGNKKQEGKNENSGEAGGAWNTPGNDKNENCGNEWNNTGENDTWNKGGDDGVNNDPWHNGGGWDNTGADNNTGEAVQDNWNTNPGDNNTGEADGDKWNANGDDNAGAGNTGGDEWCGGGGDWGNTGDGNNANCADNSWPNNKNSDSKFQKSFSKGGGSHQTKPDKNGGWENNNPSEAHNDNADDWNNKNGDRWVNSGGGNENVIENSRKGGTNRASSVIMNYTDIYPDNTFSMDDLARISRIMKRDYEQVWFRLSCAFRDKTGRHIPPHVFQEKLMGRESKDGVKDV